MVVTGDSDSYYKVLSNDETAERLKEYFKDIEYFNWKILYDIDKNWILDRKIKVL